MSREPALNLLRVHTREQHDRLEQELDWHLAASSLERYRDLVGRFHGWYAPMEERLAAAADWRALGYDFDERRKTPMLERELRALGADPATLPRCEALPEVGGREAALGCLYVIEGATLGGQVLTRHFQERLGLTPVFFASYGDQVGPRWVAFRRFLDEQMPAEAAMAPMLAAAGASFTTIGSWLVPSRSAHP